MGETPPILLNNVGVRYNMRLKKKRTLRRSITQASRFDAKGHFWALRNINLEIKDGETVAVIGGNGAGKSTLLMTLAGILAPDEGSIAVYGSIATLLHVGAGFNEMVGTGARVSDTNVIAVADVALFPAKSLIFGALSETATLPLAVGLSVNV